MQLSQQNLHPQCGDVRTTEEDRRRGPWPLCSSSSIRRENSNPGDRGFPVVNTIETENQQRFTHP
ncbi:hypothetical protein TSAR_002873, partial [Trichomalopsis sarcophagae]